MMDGLLAVRNNPKEMSYVTYHDECLSLLLKVEIFTLNE